MKNTKKYLSAGIVLAIALFSSVHIVATEPNRKENPNVAPEDRYFFKAYITDLKKELAQASDPKKISYNPEYAQQLQKRIREVEAKLYSN